MESISKLLIIGGLLMAAAGFVLYLLPKLGLGNLPLDFKYESERFGFYFPLATCIILSILLNLGVWLYNLWKQ